MPSTAKPNRGASTQHDNPSSFLKVPTHEEQRVTADVVRHSVSPARGRRPQARLGEGLHRTRLFHLAVLNRPIGESLADYEPLVLWKGINSVKQALPPNPKNNLECSLADRSCEAVTVNRPDAVYCPPNCKAAAVVDLMSLLDTLAAQTTST